MSQGDLIEKASVVLYPRGSLTGGPETEQLGRRLSQLLTEYVIGRVVINMEEVTHLNSTALGELIRARSAAIKCGKKLALCCVSGPIAETLNTTRLNSVFEVFSTMEEAIAA